MDRFGIFDHIKRRSRWGVSFFGKITANGPNNIMGSYRLTSRPFDILTEVKGVNRVVFIRLLIGRQFWHGLISTRVLVFLKIRQSEKELFNKLNLVSLRS